MTDPSFDMLLFSAELRRDQYRFFAGVFCEPLTEDALQALVTPETAELYAALGAQSPYEALCAAANGQVASDLAQEFYDLFAVPGSRFVPLAQSVYLDEREINGKTVKGLAMGDSSIAVSKAYLRAGFEPSGNKPLYPDHLAIELSFLSSLAEKETACLAADDAEAAVWRQQALEFSECHVSAWCAQPAAKVRSKTANPFYPALLDLFCAVHGEFEAALKTTCS